MKASHFLPWLAACLLVPAARLDAAPEPLAPVPLAAAAVPTSGGPPGAPPTMGPRGLPFHLPTRDAPRVRGPRDLADDWPRLLRTRGLFPLDATVTFAGRQMMRFQVHAIERGTVAGADERFQIPPGFRPTPLLPF